MRCLLAREPFRIMQPTLQFHEGTLILAGADGADVERNFGRSHPWVHDYRANLYRCDAIHYSRLRQSIDRLGGDCVDSVPNWRSLSWPHVKMPELRTEQSLAIEKWSVSQNGVVVMPTGTGKTEVALRIMLNTSISTLIVAPVRDLMYQWHRRILQSLGFDAGIIGDSTYRVCPVSVTTYESACIHMPKLGSEFGLLIFDECHHLPSEVRRDAARMSIATKRLGLTATLERSDGRHNDLVQWIGPTVYDLPLEQVRGSTLAEYEVVRIPIHLSDTEQHRYDSLSKDVRYYMQERRKTEPGFTWEQLCSESAREPAARYALTAYRQKQSIEDRAVEKLRVLEDLFRLHFGTPMIIFAGSNAMAREVSKRFLIPCMLNHCGKKERLEILEGLESGAYPALVANKVLDEGVDLPKVKVAVVIGGTSSGKQAKQRLGRILHKLGNVRATLYEIVCGDTTENQRSRRRRDNDAYQGTRHRRI